MWCEDVRLADIAAAVGTPVYVYASATLERHFDVFAAACAAHTQALGRPLIAFAVKASSNLSVIATLARRGAGADTVSEGEIRRALAAGTPPDRIIFSGVGKTDRELAFALDVGVRQINVESAPELARLAAVAAARGAAAPVAIRVNPSIGAGAHAKITTGGEHDKFGVAASEAADLYARAHAHPHLEPLGLACHIGSQIADLRPLEAAWSLLASLARDLRGAGLPVTRLDLGGGLGAPYFDRPAPPGPDAFAAAAARAVMGLDVEIAFEPGRMIAANAGVLLTSVIHIHSRPGGGRRMIVVDAAMNDLMRPALYDAFHDLRPVRPRAGPVGPFDVVGPICETTDTFCRDRGLAPVEPGDLMAFMTAGAYAASMSNEYNSRLLAPEVLVRGSRFAVVRPRPDYDQMLERERRAPWLAEGAGA